MAQTKTRQNFESNANESLKNIKYAKRYKQFKTETENKKQMEKRKTNFKTPLVWVGGSNRD